MPVRIGFKQHRWQLLREELGRIVAFLPQLAVLRAILIDPLGPERVEPDTSLIVSNHGARNLDTTFTTIEVLPDVVEAVDGRLEVYVDGGIRRGTDVLKALALGARAVLIGRPALWGLAVDGEAGVRAVLQMLRDELDLAMAMGGCSTIKSIDRSLLGTASPFTGVLPQLQDFRLPSA